MLCVGVHVALTHGEGAMGATNLEFWGDVKIGDFCWGCHQSMDGFKATSLGEMTEGGR